METREIQVGAGILDAKNVTDRTYKIYQIESAGVFRANKFDYKNPEKIAEDAAKGGDGTFEIVRFSLPVVQIWPDRGAGEQRELEFDLSREQADAVKDGRTPALHIGTPVGRLTKQFATAGIVGGPDSPDVAGEVIVVAEYTQEFNNRSQRRYDVVAHIGDRLAFDLEKGIEIAQDAAANSKQVASTKAAY